MPQYILQTKELCKEFAHTAAVNRVSMNIQQGDIYGFIGENGAGKTSLCQPLPQNTKDSKNFSD